MTAIAMMSTVMTAPMSPVVPVIVSVVLHVVAIAVLCSRGLRAEQRRAKQQGASY
jgi:hypothetical protein